MYNPRKIPDEHLNLFFPQTLTSWDEAIPLGNGLCGALIWGTSKGLRFSLDRGDLWDTTPYDGIFDEEFSYPTMVKLAREKNADEIRRVFDAPYNQPLPSKLPAGKLIFDFRCNANVCSELNLRNAEAVVTVGGTIRLRSFLHAGQKVGMIRLNRPLSAFSFRVERPPYGTGEKAEGDRKNAEGPVRLSLDRLSYPVPEIVSEKNLCYFTQDIDAAFSYGVFAMLREHKYSVDIAYMIASSRDGENWKRQALDALADALGQGYDVMLQSHAAWWEAYWGKSSVTLPDELFEKNWYLAQYYLASCSRKGAYPMPLQGVWTADDGSLPPWKGDYHFDLNVQLTYASYLKANHFEEGEALTDYLWAMADCGRKFAKSFYHAKGLCLPSTMTIDGTPLGGWGMYSLSPTNQLWICQLMERHYRYTGDRKFLEERAYPYLAETAEFILDILEKRDGQYYLPVSTSPEIHDDRIEAFLTPNSNYDLALMRYLFQALEKLSTELQNGETARWNQALSGLPELSVKENGVFMLSPDEELRESHRHFSHAMAIHPLRLIPYEGEENRRIIDATILDLERLGTGFWVGFSFAWMAELYAVQQNGNGAAQQLELFWRNYCLPNGFHVNGDYRGRGTSTFHYRAFTLEGNFCAADALQEMLLQSENHTLSLFPAVPDEWEEETVAFDQFAAENGLLVSAAMQKGSVTSLSLQPKYSGTVYLKKSEKTASLIRTIQERLPEKVTAGSDRIGITLSAKTVYRFETETC